MKVKVNNLRDLEGEPEIKGLGLVALEKAEVDSVRQVIGPKPSWR